MKYILGSNRKVELKFKFDDNDNGAVIFELHTCSIQFYNNFFCGSCMEKKTTLCRSKKKNITHLFNTILQQFFAEVT